MLIGNGSFRTLVQPSAIRVTCLRAPPNGRSNTGDKLRGGAYRREAAERMRRRLQLAGRRREPRQLHRLVRPPRSPPKSDSPPRVTTRSVAGVGRRANAGPPGASPCVPSFAVDTAGRQGELGGTRPCAGVVPTTPTPQLGGTSRI